MTNLEELIRTCLPLGRQSSQGYFGVKCAVCGDYKVRGGFKFEHGEVHYNCFNCSLSAGTKNGRPSKKLRDVLRSFGLADEDVNRAVGVSFKRDDQPTEPIKPELKHPAPLELPPFTTKVSDRSSEWAEVCEAYLRSRGLDPTEFAYLVSSDLRYQGRVIIPCYFRGAVTYWQARDLTGTSELRYLNPLISRDNIMFNADEAYRHGPEPLFVTEGPLDALSLGKNAVALLGSTLSPYKLHALKYTRRPVVFIIDKNANGFKLGNHALDVGGELGWKVVCLPENIDDANDALRKGLGRLWLLSYVVEHACNGFQGRLHLKLHCKA